VSALEVVALLLQESAKSCVSPELAELQKVSCWLRQEQAYKTFGDTADKF